MIGTSNNVLSSLPSQMTREPIDILYGMSNLAFLRFFDWLNQKIGFI